MTIFKAPALRLSVEAPPESTAGVLTLPSVLGGQAGGVEPARQQHELRPPLKAACSGVLVIIIDHYETPEDIIYIQFLQEMHDDEASLSKPCNALLPSDLHEH